MMSRTGSEACGWRLSMGSRQRVSLSGDVQVTITRLGQFALEQSGGDDGAEDLRRAPTDGEHAGIAHDAFKRQVARISGSAEHLERLICDRNGSF